MLKHFQHCYQKLTMGIMNPWPRSNNAYIRCNEKTPSQSQKRLTLMWMSQNTIIVVVFLLVKISYEWTETIIEKNDEII